MQGLPGGHVYVAMRDVDTYMSALAEPSVGPLDSGQTDPDGERHRLVVMRFGPGSVDGWLGRLVAREPGIDPTGLLDEASRHRRSEVGANLRRPHARPLA